MKRRILTFLSALSLLLCVAVCVLCVRSYWMADVATRSGSAIDWQFRSNHGCLTISRVWHESASDVPWRASSEPACAPSQAGFAGFSHQHIVYDVGIFADFERRDAAVPHWVVSLLLAIPPALWLRAAARRRRSRRLGHCGSCGYDLRATPDRCPECGTVPANATVEAK